MAHGKQNAQREPAIAAAVAHANRINRQSRRPRWIDAWYHRPVRVKRLLKLAEAGRRDAVA